jgi:RNA polymerase sigma-70 factor (ECF subfamily)
VSDDLASRILAAGHVAWPEIVIAPETVAKHVADRTDEDAGLPEHDADVYLAIALAEQNPAALRVFEDKLVPHVDQALRRLRLPPTTKDEVRQTVRTDLLVGNGAPKIADYAGRGELSSWLRVTATRKALSLLRKTNREEVLDELLLDHMPDTSIDPAEQHMRAKYVAELKRAIHDAFAALEVRQRNLLRQHILDELTIDDLARLYRAHRATCARWLADARAELGKATRKRLIASLGIDRDDVDSLLRFLDSDIELSISRIMRDKAKGI